jgi:hypothetical protein
MTRSPRCGRPVRRYELPGVPVLDEPVCGRPEDHNGRCRSAAAVARKQAADNASLAEVRRDGQRYGWPVERMAAPVAERRAAA